MGGWKLGNTRDGAQADYVLIPDAEANLAPIPDALSDEDVLLCPDILSTGISGAERAGVRLGDTVAVFAQGPNGLCATAGARLLGATRIFVVDRNAHRLEIARGLGADVLVDATKSDPVATIREQTGGRGVDVAIEALGTPGTLESCLRVVRPAGTVSSLGVYDKTPTLPVDAFAAGLGDRHLLTTLCPGGKDRMRRVMALVAAHRLDFRPFVTHRYALADILEAYELFAAQRDGVLKVAITP